MGEIDQLTFISRLGITPEFKKGEDVHSSSISSLLYAVPLLDLAGISTEFYGAITTEVCFT